MLETPARLMTADEAWKRIRSTAPEPRMVLPDYSGLSTCNVAQLIWKNFELPNRCPELLAPLLDRPYRRII